MHSLQMSFSLIIKGDTLLGKSTTALAKPAFKKADTIADKLSH